MSNEEIREVPNPSGNKKDSNARKRMLVYKDTMVAIGDAIRAKTGKTDKIMIGDLPEESANLGGGSQEYNIYCYDSSNDPQDPTKWELIDSVIALGEFDSDENSWVPTGNPVDKAAPGTVLGIVTKARITYVLNDNPTETTSPVTYPRQDSMFTMPAHDAYVVVLQIQADPIGPIS